MNRKTSLLITHQSCPASMPHRRLAAKRLASAAVSIAVLAGGLSTVEATSASAATARMNTTAKQSTAGPVRTSSAGPHTSGAPDRRIGPRRPPIRAIAVDAILPSKQYVGPAPQPYGCAIDKDTQIVARTTQAKRAVARGLSIKQAGPPFPAKNTAHVTDTITRSGANTLNVHISYRDYKLCQTIHGRRRLTESSATRNAFAGSVLSGAAFAATYVATAAFLGASLPEAPYIAPAIPAFSACVAGFASAGVAIGWFKIQGATKRTLTIFGSCVGAALGTIATHKVVVEYFTRHFSRIGSSIGTNSNYLRQLLRDRFSAQNANLIRTIELSAPVRK